MGNTNGLNYQEITWMIVIFLLFPVLNWVGFFQFHSFLDGLTYGAISSNWAGGEGSFWNMHYTEYLYSYFVEHPPLFFFIEGLLFKVFGNGPWTEEILMSCCWMATIFLFIRFLKLANPKAESFWPLLLLFLLPSIYWSLQNNMIEPLFGVFTLGLIYSWQKVLIKSSSLVYSILASLCLIAAFLTKGVIALPLLFWPVIIRVVEDKSAEGLPFGLFYSLQLFFWISMFNYEPSQGFWMAYLDKQVLGSAGMGWISFSELMRRLFTFLPIPLILGLILFLGHRYKLAHRRVDQFLTAEVVLIIAYIIPWLIFTKFHFHYWYTAALLMVLYIMRQWEFKSLTIHIRQGALALLLAGTIGWMIPYQEKTQVDLVQLPRWDHMKEVKVDAAMCFDYYLIAAFQRIRQMDVGCAIEGPVAIFDHPKWEICPNGQMAYEYFLCNE